MTSVVSWNLWIFRIQIYIITRERDADIEMESERYEIPYEENRIILSINDTIAYNLNLQILRGARALLILNNLTLFAVQFVKIKYWFFLKKKWSTL